MAGKRYDELTPEQIARDKARKRLGNRRQQVEKWWPRIEAEVKEERTRDDS